MTVEQVLGMGIPIVFTLLGYANLAGKLKERQDNQGKDLERQQQLDDEKLERLHTLEKEMVSLRVAVIGVDGGNGIRGEVREMKKQLQELIQSLKDK